MKKRILALALAVVMLLSMVPAQVFATGPVIQGGIHTEHNYEPVTNIPTVTEPQQETNPEETQEPEETLQTQTSSQSQGEESVLPLEDSTLESPHTHSLDGTSDNLTFATELESAADLENALTSGVLSTGRYVLLEDIDYAGGNITISDDVYLCLAGKKLNLGTNCMEIGSGANLYVYDCTATGSIESTHAECTINNNGGEMYLYGGTIKNDVATTGTNMGSAILVRSGSSLTVEGGTVSSLMNSAILNYGTTEVNGGHIAITGTKVGRDANRMGGLKNNGGTAHITGGSFSTVVTGTDNYDAYAQCVITFAGETTIDGGTFSGYNCIRTKGGTTTLNDATVYATSIGVSTDGGTTYIKGGEYHGNTGLLLGDYGDPTVYVTGGTFGDENSNYGVLSKCGNLYVQSGKIVSKNLGIFVHTEGTVHLTGGNIDAVNMGVQLSTGGILYMSGSPVIKAGKHDIYFAADKSPIHLTPEGILVHPEEGGYYTVGVYELTRYSKVQITDGWEEYGEMTIPLVNNQGYEIHETDFVGKRELFILPAGAMELYPPHEHDEKKFYYPAVDTELSGLGSGSCYMMNDLIGSSQYVLSNKTIHLCLNGRSFDNYGHFVFTPKDGSDIYIYDCTGNGQAEFHSIVIDGVYINQYPDYNHVLDGTGSSALHLKSGTYTCTTVHEGMSQIPIDYHPKSDGGVALYHSGSRFYLEGATLNLCDANDPQIMGLADGARVVLVSGTINDTVGTGCISADPAGLDLEMNGPVVLNSANGGAEILLNNGAMIFVSGNITPAAGETYVVKLDDEGFEKLEAGESVQITKDFGDYVTEGVPLESYYSNFTTFTKLVDGKNEVFIGPIPPHDHTSSEDGEGLIFKKALTEDTFVLGEDGYELPEGDYYLSSALDLSSLSAKIVVKGNVSLCLYGSTLTLGANYIDVQSGTLNIYDCAGTGRIESTNDQYAVLVSGGEMNLYGGTIYTAIGNAIHNQKTLNIYGGSVISEGDGTAKGYAIHNTAGEVNIYGGLVDGLNYGIYNDGAKVTIYDGTISSADNGIDNRNSGVLTVSGGSITGSSERGILNTNATVVVTGGTITGKNHGITNTNNGIITVTGGTIIGTGTGKSGVYHNGGSFELSGEPGISGKTSDIYLGNGKVITVSDSITGSYTVLTEEKPDVTNGSKVLLTSGWSAHSGTIPFTSAVSPYEVIEDSGELYLWFHEHSMTENGASVIFTSALMKSSVNGGTLPAGDYVLTANQDLSSLTGPIVIDGIVNLCLKGFTLNLGTNCIEVVNGGQLNICDCQAGGTITSSNTDCTILNSGGELNLYSGTIKVSGTSSIKSQSTTNIHGGTVTGSTYGIYVEEGTLIVNDGSVNGTTAAIYNKGTTNVHGGTITGTTSGIENASGSLTVTNGAIQAASHGILLVDGEATVSGGSIAHTTQSKFVGIRVGIEGYDYPAKLTMSGGSILSTGRGIEINSGEAMISGCNIHSTDDSATSLINGTLTVTGGTFAGDKFAGIYVKNGTFNLKGAPVLSGGEAQIKLQGDDSAKITLIGELTGDNPSYSVMRTGMGGVISEDNPIQFTNNWDEYKDNYTSYPFYHYKHEYRVDERVTSEGKTELHFVVYHKHTISTDCHVDTDGVEPDENVTFTNVLTQESVPASGNLVLGPGAYVLESSITFQSGQNIQINGEVDLCLAGCSITFNGRTDCITIGKDAVLNICDCSEEKSGLITTTVSGGSYFIECVGEFNLFGGTINSVYNGTLTTMTTEDASPVVRIYGGTLDSQGMPTVTHSKGEIYIYGGTIRSNAIGLNASAGTKIYMDGGVVSSTGTGINSNGHIEIVSGTVTATNIGIFAGDCSELFIKGGTISGDSMGVQVGSSQQQGAANATISGGTISSKGTGIYVYAYNSWDGYTHQFFIPKLTVTDGEISGDTIGIESTGDVLLQGGSVTGATAIKHTADVRTVGGEYLIEFGGTFVIEDAQITGDVRNESNMEIKGGTISGMVDNTTRSGTFYNFPHTFEGDLTITGGTITSGTYGINQNGILNMSGSPVITGGADKADIYLASGKVVNVVGALTGTDTYSVLTADTPEEGKPVQITSGWATYGVGVTEYPFTSKNSAYRVVKGEGDELYLVIGHQHCLYGSNCADVKAGKACTHEQVGFVTALTESYVKALNVYVDEDGVEQYGLEGGSYVLTDDIVTVDKNISIRGTVNLCLNGHTLDLLENVIVFNTDGNLNICDCNGNGKITSNNYTATIHYSFGTLNFYSGTIEHPVAYDQNNQVYDKDGLLILPSAIRSNSKLNIYGGTIHSTHHGIYPLHPTGSEVNIYDGVIEGINGSGVYVGDCKFVVINGENVKISGTTALHAMGGNVTITAGTLSSDKSNGIYIEGGNVTVRETAVVKGKYHAIALKKGTLSIADAPTIESTQNTYGSIWLSEGMVINIPGKLDGTYTVTTEVKPTEAAPVKITSNWTNNSGSTATEDNSFLLVSKDSAYSVRLKNDGELYLVVPHKHYMAVDTDKGLPNADGGNDARPVDFTIAISSYDDLLALDADADTGGIQLPTGDYVLTGTVTCNLTIYVTGDVNLCLNGYTLEMLGYKQMIVKSAGTLNICDCNKSGNGKGCITSNILSGGTIRVEEEGTLRLYGGAVENTGTAQNGLTIYNAGLAEIKGGSVTGKSCVYNDGTLKISGAPTLTATYSGNYAGIINNPETDPSLSPIIEISGGTITAAGTGIDINSGTVTLSGTAMLTAASTGIANEGGSLTIKDNASVSATGPAIVNSAGTLTMTGGTVTGASAPTLVNCSAANISGGSLTGNGIVIQAESGSNTTISGAIVTGKGNAPVVNNLGTVKISGGTVTGGGTAPTVINSNTVEISGGTISGGIYGVQHVGKSLSMSGAPGIKGDTADIYLSGGNVINVVGALTGTDSYSVYTAVEPTESRSVCITSLWPSSSNTRIPFTDARNTYAVGKLNNNTNPSVLTNLDEVYLYIPPIYKVYIDEGIVNGTVTADPMECTDGTTVTLTATPAEGFNFGGITATYGDGQTVTVSPAENGSYTFTMPAADVTVTAVFDKMHVHAYDLGRAKLANTTKEYNKFTPDVFADKITEGDVQYVLDQDWVLSENLVIESDYNVYLCLNGHSLTFNTGSLIIRGGSVQICDCQYLPAEDHKPLDCSGEIVSRDGSGIIVEKGTLAMIKVQVKGKDKGLVVKNGTVYIYGGYLYGETDYGIHNVGGTVSMSQLTVYYPKGYPEHKGVFMIPLFAEGGQFGIYHEGVKSHFQSNNVTETEDHEYPIEGNKYTLNVYLKGGIADIYVASGKQIEANIYVRYKHEPEQVFSVKTADLPEVNEPVMFATNFKYYRLNCDETIFTNVDGYDIVADDNSYYLVVPTVDLHLWKDKTVTLSKETLIDKFFEKNSGGLLDRDVFEFMSFEFVPAVGLTYEEGTDGYTFTGTVLGETVGTLIMYYTDDIGTYTMSAKLAINAKVYDTADLVYVLDYGYAAKLPNNYFVGDTLGGTDMSIVPETVTSVEPIMGDDGHTMTIVSMDKAQTLYGDFTYEEGSIIYTPTGMINGADSAYLIFRVHQKATTPGTLGTIDPFKEAEMYKKVTVIPANVVYYEDDNEALNWNSKENPGISIQIVGEPTGDGYQDGDNNSEYGNDSDYAYAPDGNTYEDGDYSSGGYSKKITVTATGPVLEFSFTGTGFDLIGSTTADSGQFMYKVTKGGSLIQSGALDTSYGAWDSASSTGDSAIHQVPLLHVHDLAHGTYDVLIQAVANYNWYAPQDQWVNGMPPVIPIYLYFDGVRVYNPMIDNREEYIAGEATAEFLQIRGLILNGKAAAAKIDENGLFSFGSGLVSYVETAKNGMTYEGNKVTSLNDYMLAGPNNEAYFNEKTQTLVLYVKETGEEDVVPMMQIGVRNMNPEAFGKSGDAVTAPELLLLGEKGTTAQTLVSGEKAIGFTEQYYTVHYTDCVQEEINGVTYYRVVISSSKDAPFALTNLKVSGLEFYTIPASAASYKYDANGNLMETTNPDVTVMPSLQELAWQLQAANGMLPGDDTESDTTEELKFSSVSLSLQSSIGMNFYVAKETLEQYTRPQLLVTMEDKSLGENGEGLVIDTYEMVTVGEKEYYVFSFNDITAKEMTHTVTATLKAEDENGDLKTGETRDYSVVTYASNMLKKNIPDALKTLLVDMVNYGAEAQLRFACKTDRLANADFDAYQQYASETVAEYVSCSESTGAEDYAFKMAGVSIALNEKVEMSFFVTPKTERDFTDTKLVVTYFDVSGNTVVKEIPYSAEVFTFENEENNLYKVIFDDLNATDMRTPVTAWLADTEGMRISNSKTYSIESYAASVKAKADGGYAAYEAMMPLIDAMMKYGDAAQAYFGNTTANAQ